MSEQITASAVISFCSEWEDQAARFYQTLAEHFAAQAQVFNAMASECAKHKALVQRTYQETVSDILETGYAFTDLKPSEYQSDLTVAADTTLTQAVAQAIALETNAVAFYMEVTRRSEGLLATIPRAFTKVASKRAERLQKLRAL
jgi:rubrerythrin